MPQCYRCHDISYFLFRAIELRRVLSRVPEEMADRHQFLETIKLIASSIKKLLEAINAVHLIVPQSAQQGIFESILVRWVVLPISDVAYCSAVEKRKREFVHYSKRFSNTLKTYFKDQNAVQVRLRHALWVFSFLHTSIASLTFEDSILTKYGVLH